MSYFDKETNKVKIAIWKFGKTSEPEAYKRISKQVAVKISPLFRDVDDHFFSIDNPVQKRANQ